MIKKIIYSTLAVGLGIVLFASCSKYEMIKYSQKPCINFMGTDNSGLDSDDTTTLKASLNFGTNVKGDQVDLDTILVGIKVQGMIPEEDLKVAFEIATIDGSEAPEIVFMDQYVIKSGTYKGKVGIPIKRPKERNKEYKCNLVFKFGEGNDFSVGTIERQRFNLTIKDQVNLEICGLKKEDWDYWGARTIGDYSENKLRFMIVVLETSNFANMANYGPNATAQKKLRDALTDYNEKNPSDPLKDENGKLIRFDPIK